MRLQVGVKLPCPCLFKIKAKCLSILVVFIWSPWSIDIGDTLHEDGIYTDGVAMY